MLRTRVIPCLLLRNASLVKTVRFRNPTYVGDPINTVRIYNEKEVDEIVILDITATPEGKNPNYQMISDIAGECFMPLAYGGGVRTVEDVKRVFGLGVEKIVINSHAHENPRFIREVADCFGNQSVVVSMDVQKNLFGKYLVKSHGGRRSTGRDPVEWALEMEGLGAGEILLTSIDRDGTFRGYDVGLISQVTRRLGIPVIACGGAGKIMDFAEAVKVGGASAVAAGSMVVYQGPNRSVLINFPAREELEAVLE